MTNLNEMNIDYVRKVNQLKPHNRKAFDYIANKITTKVTLSEDESDELLLEILDDLLIAQRNGKSANSFFGEDLDQFVDDISIELSKRSFKSILLFGTFTFSIMFSILFVIFGFADFLSWISVVRHIKIPVLSATLIVIVFIIFSLLSIFLDSNAQNRTKTQNIIQALSLFLSYSITYFIFNFVKQGPYFSFPFYLSLPLAAVFIVTAIYIKKKYFPKKQFI